MDIGFILGAMAGGIASGSLHGFAWFFAALPGTWLGIRLRAGFADGAGAPAAAPAGN